MKLKLLIPITFLLILFSKPSFSVEKGIWSFVKENDWCYIGSMPVKTDLPKSKKRGENYILVYKIIGSDENIVQIEAGYSYNLIKDISIKIDNTNFKLYSTKDSSETAWTNDDKKIIYAMKKGLDLILSGESVRGTVTKEIYTLKGFTAALNQLNKDC